MSCVLGLALVTPLAFMVVEGHGAGRVVIAVADVSGCLCGYVLHKDWHEPRGRGTLSSCLSAFGVCACVLSFFAKS